MFPWKSGTPPFNISAMIQPTDHTSTALPYSLIFSSNSGARYHRVTTFLVRGRSGFSAKSKERFTDLTGESEVSDFKDAFSVEKEVGEFEIAMNHILGVSVANLLGSECTPLISCKERHLIYP